MSKLTIGYGKSQKYKGMEVLITHGSAMDYHMVTVEVFDPISGETLRLKGSNILRNVEGFIEAINGLIVLLKQWRDSL